jgi:hypothetical protein
MYDCDYKLTKIKIDPAVKREKGTRLPGCSLHEAAAVRLGFFGQVSPIAATTNIRRSSRPNAGIRGHTSCKGLLILRLTGPRGLEQDAKRLQQPFRILLLA